jgi:hypothetical protein
MLGSILPLFKKGAIGELFVFLESHISSQFRIVTTFEYGDLVVFDLRAKSQLLDYSCVRGNIMVDVAKKDAIDIDAVRDGLAAQVRPLVVDLLGSGSKISGTEIVCVREVFNEGE